METNTKQVKSVWMFTREYGTLAGAGGVKDVAAQLSKTLARWTARKVHVVLPLYGFMDPIALGFEPLVDPDFPDRNLSYDIAMNYEARERTERIHVWTKISDRVRIYLLESERYREKAGVYTYTREEFQRESWKVQGAGHVDYFAMNVLLQKAGLELMVLLKQRPEIVHCHDGHTAIVPALMRELPGYRSYFRQTASVVTIHNAGIGYHQEVSDLNFVQAITGLPWRVINDSCLEHSFDPFIAAGKYCTMTTVSENYARELQETEDDYLTGWLGHRLKDINVTIHGITNGIDPADFDPSRSDTDGLAKTYDVSDLTDNLAGKAACKDDLLATLAQPPEEEENRVGFLSGKSQWPLYSFIGRLSTQKGVDILAEAVRLFLLNQANAQVVFLGNGGTYEESLLTDLAEDDLCRGRVCFLRGFDSGIANMVYAAGDFFVIPSRYEPCGLTDYIAQLFGNLPIVHHVGGLVKVVDGKTGFAYTENNPEILMETMVRAGEVYKNKKLMRQMQRDSVVKIERHHTWSQVMKSYSNLYKQGIEEQIQ